ESRIIGKAREINNHKAFWCAEKVKAARKAFQLKNNREPTVALMGMAFKPNIDDLRESPAKYIVQRILQDANDEEYFIVEPNISTHHLFKLTNYKQAVDQADIIVFLVAHNEFKFLEASLDGKIVLDFCGVTNS